MGSPQRRLLRLSAALVAAGVCAAAAVATASADSTDDARATAAAFLDAYVHGDADRVCGLYSTDLLRRTGGLARCKAGFEASEDEADYEAMQSLYEAYEAAQDSAAPRGGRYITKKFGKGALAREIERMKPDLTVKLGKGPKAASGQLVTTVILDTRSTARRLVLYAESDDGSIMRLSASARGRPDFEEVATGVPEAPGEGLPAPELTASVTALTLDSGGVAFARGSLVITHRGVSATFDLLLVLVPTPDGYRLDDLFYSILSGP